MRTLTLKVCLAVEYVTKKEISETGKTPLCSPFLVAETNHSSLVYLVKTCVTLILTEVTKSNPDFQSENKT